MAEEVTFIGRFDDSQIEAALSNVATNVEEIQADFNKMSEAGNKSFQETAKAVDTAEESVKELAKRNAEYNDSVKRVDAQQKRFLSTMKQSIRNTNILGVNVGNTVDKLKGFRSNIADSIGSMRGAARGAGVLRGAMVAVGGVIGGVVIAAIGAVIAALTRFQGNLDKIRVLTAQVTAAFDVLVDRFATIGSNIIAVVSGQKSLTEAWNDSRESLSGLNEDLSQAIQFAREYEELQIDLERSTSLLNTRIALQRGEIRRLNEISRDVNNTFSERADAAREASELENKLLDEQIALIEQKVGAEIGALKINEQTRRTIKDQIDLIREGEASYKDLRDLLTETTPTIARDEDVETFLGLVKELGTSQEQSLRRQTELTQNLNRIEAERARAIRERLQNIQDLQDQVAESNAILGGPAEVARRQYDLAVRKINELKREAASLGLELNFGALETIAAAQFERAKDAALGELAEIPDGVDNLGDQLEGKMAAGIDQFLEPLRNSRRDFTQEGLEVGQTLAEAFARGIEETDDRPIGEIISEKLQRAFDINQQQLQFIGQSAQEVFTTIVGGINATTEAAIVRQDQLIQSIQNRINETESLLAEEEERRRQGFANDVDALREKLDAENRARQQAEAERLALERRAAKIRLVQNSLEQASNFVLAAARLTAAEAGKGIIGLFTALGGLAILGRIISQAKAISTQFEPPAFREGTEYVTGPGTKTSDSIAARLSVGERVVPANMNDQIGGRSVSNEELVSMFHIGQMFADGQLRKLYEMTARSMLPEAISEMQRTRSRHDQLKVNIPFQMMQSSYEKAANNAADKMIEYWKSRPTEWVDGDGTKVIQRQTGNRIERRKIKPKK